MWLKELHFLKWQISCVLKVHTAVLNAVNHFLIYLSSEMPPQQPLWVLCRPLSWDMFWKTFLLYWAVSRRLCLWSWLCLERWQVCQQQFLWLPLQGPVLWGTVCVCVPRFVWLCEESLSINLFQLSELQCSYLLLNMCLRKSLSLSPCLCVVARRWVLWKRLQAKVHVHHSWCYMFTLWLPPYARV